MTNPLDQLKARVDAAVDEWDDSFECPACGSHWFRTGHRTLDDTETWEYQCKQCLTAVVGRSNFQPDRKNVTLIQDLWALVQAQQGEIERLSRNDTFGRMVEAAMKEVVPRSQEADDFTAAGKQGGYLK